MKASYSQIKGQAKNRLSGRFGDAALIVFIPSIIGMIINLILGQIFAVLPDVAGLITQQFVSLFVTTWLSFVTLRFMLDFARGKNGVELEQIFKLDGRFKPFLIYTVVISLANLLAMIPLLPMYIDILSQAELLADPAAMEAYIESTNFTVTLLINAGLTLGILLVIAIILVRLQFTGHLIINKHLSVVDAMKKSMEITRGNWFRVFFFPFAFFFWFLLIIVTCGLAMIYVIPYYTVAHTYLYFALMKENGEVGEEFVHESLEIPTFVGNDPLENSLEEEKKEDDPFDYYE